jgi:hypothetical protein
VGVVDREDRLLLLRDRTTCVVMSMIAASTMAKHFAIDTLFATLNSDPNLRLPVLEYIWLDDVD